MGRHSGVRIAIIGRSQLLLESARRLLEQGNIITLVVTARPAPEYTAGLGEFESLAIQAGAKYILTPHINSEQAQDAIRDSGPHDLAVSVNYPGILSQQTIDLFPLGVLNAHAGDLPRYRGNAPLAWAILNGESMCGLCVHRMVGGELDSGDILARDFHPITNVTRLMELTRWTEQQVPLLMLNAVTLLRENPQAAGEKQSHRASEALRCYPRRPEDGRIDWSLGSAQILRLINASSEPLAGAFCTFEEKPLVIWRASPMSKDEEFCAVAGQIISKRTSGEVVVATGQAGKLLIEEVSYEGERLAPSAIVKSLRQRFC